MINILFAAVTENWSQYQGPLKKELDLIGLEYKLAERLPPSEVDYIIYAPNSSIKDFSVFTNLKAVLNLWAGVENVVKNETLTVPLAKMVDEGLTQGMKEWVLGHVMRHHLGIDLHVFGQDGQWRDWSTPPLASERNVTILGLGALGAECASALAKLGFKVRGWSLTKKSIDNVTCHYGFEGLEKSLLGSEIVVLLLPSTANTENIINLKTISFMSKNAIIINPGRGTLIDDKALLKSLDDGKLAHATLDVFRQEPLPADHLFWQHSKVTVTPHIASETRPSTASQVIATNIERFEKGKPLLYQVNFGAGY
jgi:glyoxylate/hydroxypyruvate reductase A|tara:strand:+ start:3393 stop:4325 length:933 start_codon:yes stop_codon:yes gene_type:complete